MMNAEELAIKYKDCIKRLIVRVSFEERSILIPRWLRGNPNITVSAFFSKRHSDSANSNKNLFLKDWENTKPVALDTYDPIQSAMEISKLISKHAEEDRLQDTLIDISSFRREELLVLIARLRSLEIPKLTNCQLAYVCAEKMADDWLSRNVMSHRSVVSFPGEIWPSRNTKLVVMVGFGEIDRARSIIENYEPAQLLLGMGRQEDSINQELYERNKDFFSDLLRQFNGEEKRFEFSVSDPLQTARDLESVIKLDDKTNIIIAPLHSKLSTIGAGLFAHRNPTVQICYAPVEEYNEDVYSTPGDKIRIVPLSDLLDVS
ncbi:MAG: hypothetical protein HQL67_11565 [Magnetococcales bacterium]|nr:hypothetical protein [Magnetococcales bacterium]